MENEKKHILKDVIKQQQLELSTKGNVPLTPEEIKKAKKKARLKMIFRIVFMLLSLGVILIIFFTEFSDDNIEDIGAVLARSDSVYMLAFSVLSIIVIMLLQVLRMSLILKQFTGKFHPLMSYKVTQLGRYYDNLTPSSLGGQPSQIYYFHKSGLSMSQSSGATISYFLAFQYAFVINAIVLFIIERETLSSYGTLINVLAYVGLGFLLVLPMFLLVISLNEKLGTGIMRFVFGIAKKLKLIKPDKYEKMWTSSYNSLMEYKSGLANMYKHFFTSFLPQILITMLEVFVLAIVPYFVLRAFGGSAEYSIFQIAAIYLFVHCASSLMPTPGMTGGAELLFLTGFAVVLSDSPLFWAMVCWRFLTFYFYLIQGFFITLADTIICSVRESKRILANESALVMEVAEGVDEESEIKEGKKDEN